MNRTTRKFRVAELLECAAGCTHAVHFICPYCGGEASVARNQVTEVFSVRCHYTGELFLVDQEWIVATSQQTAARVV